MIVNESPEPDPIYKQRRSISKNEQISSEVKEPIAEALVQNEPTFHQLKILKSSTSDKGNRERFIPAINENKQSVINKGVFSQVSDIFNIMFNE